LRETLRALAFSSFLLNDVLEIPACLRGRWLLLDSADAYRRAVDEARRKGGLNVAEAELAVQLRGYRDRRGCGVLFHHLEAGAAAGLLYHLDPYTNGAQACLRAGHLNHVCLSYLGIPLPKIVLFEREGGKIKVRDSYGEVGNPTTDFCGESLRRDSISAAGIPGLRLGMAYLAERGRDPPWYRAMLDDMGKVRGAYLQKATMVVVYLQEQGPLMPFLNETRPCLPRNKTLSTPHVFERILEERLSAFERRWRDWIIPCKPGLAEELEGPATDSHARDQEKLIEGLHEIRKQGVGRARLGGKYMKLSLKEQDKILESKAYREIYDVMSDRDLSNGARLHTLYLLQHQARAGSWPDILKEDANRSGFSTEGAWAGLHGLVARNVSGPEGALALWMAHMHHRPFLLHPGLLRVGFWYKNRTAVLDAGSFVASPLMGEWTVLWPHDGMDEVPLKHASGGPDPVPGRDGSRLGYPVTLQVWRSHRLPEVKLRLYEGPDRTREVPCFLSTPSKPLNPTLAPAHTFCLIPEAPLKPRIQYTVTAVLEDPNEELTWSFRTGR
jgi:hypothetical protein